MSLNKRLSALENSPLQLAIESISEQCDLLGNAIDDCIKSWLHLVSGFSEADKHLTDTMYGDAMPLIDNAEYQDVIDHWQRFNDLARKLYSGLSEHEQTIFCDTLESWLQDDR